MDKNEQAADTPERAYIYYVCEGTYEDNGSGGRRCVCSGHIFTRETNMNRCPACGKALSMLISKKERPEAITCAMEKCIGCENRERSAAVNDEHCLGGESYKNGRIQKVIGSRLCDGCLCDACCKEIIDETNAIKKHGVNAAVKAKVQLKETVRRLVQEGSLPEEAEKVLDELKTQNTVLQDIRKETFYRWAIDAMQAVEKEGKSESQKPRPLGTVVSLTLDGICKDGAA